MSFHTINTSSCHLLYWKPSHDIPITSKLLAIDLDHTFIKPKSGSVFPKNSDDWTFCYDDISILHTKAKNGYSIVFMTNQKALNTPAKVADFKTKWINILAAVSIDTSKWCLIAALDEDIYRKPCVGMWNFAISEFNSGVSYKLEDSIFVGDAAGRKHDFSAADIMFAMNVGISFSLPEVFFEGKTNKTLMGPYLMNKITESDKYFNPRKFLLSHNIPGQLPDLTDILTCPLIIMIGSPASGKSTFCKKYLHSYKHMNNDTFTGTVAAFRKKIITHLKSGSHVVIDNTNPSIEVRAKWVSLAQQYNVRVGVIYMEATNNKAYVQHMLSLRRILGIQSVPLIAQRIFYKKLVKPTLNEGFVAMVSIPLMLEFSDKGGVGVTKAEFLWWLN